MLNIKAAELHIERYGSKFSKMQSDFRPNEMLSIDEMREKQNLVITRLVRHAYETVPYYRSCWKEIGISPEDINNVDDLKILPVLNKEDIISNPNAFISSKAGTLRKGNTSGTTGSSLNVYYDIPTCVAHHVVDWRQKTWGGMNRGSLYASLQGRMVVPSSQEKPPFWRKNYIHNQVFLSAFHLKPEHIHSYVEYLERSKIQYIEGYPSTIGILASWLNYNSRCLPLASVFTSSETLNDLERASIEKAFGCKVFDSLGMAERVLFATECEEHVGRHLNEDYGITEILDDSDMPVNDGAFGRLVATSLWNFAFPLIRYQTNDVSARLSSQCACGRLFPRIQSVTTKEEAIITLPDGRLISPSILTHPFKPMNLVASSQILQEGLHNVRVRLVTRDGYGADDEKLLLSGLKDRLGDDVNITFEYVDSVLPPAGKKFRWVISSVKPSI